MPNRNLRLVFADTLLSGLALYISFLLRFEFNISDFFFSIFLSWLPWFVILQILVFHFMRMYDRIWRYTSLFDLYAIITAVAISTGASILCIFLGGVTNEAYPRSVLIMYLIFNALFTLGSRLSVRVYYSHFHKDSLFRKTINVKSCYLLVQEKPATNLQEKY